jgi:hypothetical protein
MVQATVHELCQNLHANVRLDKKISALKGLILEALLLMRDFITNETKGTLII